MDEVTRLALEQAWEDGWISGYATAHGDSKEDNPYSRKGDSDAHDSQHPSR